MAIIIVDYPNQARLKILGQATVFEGDKAWIERVRVQPYRAVVERAIVIHLDAFDWNCPQHITPRYTADEIRRALEPTIARIEELEDRLRKAEAH